MMIQYCLIPSMVWLPGGQAGQLLCTICRRLREAYSSAAKETASKSDQGNYDACSKRDLVL